MTLEQYARFIDDTLSQGANEFLAASPAESQRLLIRFNREIDQLIDQWSESMVGDAVWYLYGCVSGVTHDVLQPKLSGGFAELYDSLRDLYDQGFAAHCQDEAGHSDRSHSLATACYMLWDMDSGLEYHSFHGHPLALSAMDELLDFGLAHRHAAVQESFLHCLGHRASSFSDRVAARIDRFLKRNDISTEIRDYALACRGGCIL